VVPRPRVWTHQPSGCKGTTTKAWSQPRPWQGHENLNKWTTRGVSVSEIYGHFWPDHLKKTMENWKITRSANDFSIEMTWPSRHGKNFEKYLITVAFFLLNFACV
jgi:hypothetical protein